MNAIPFPVMLSSLVLPFVGVAVWGLVSVTGAVHAELNDQLFGPTGGRGGPMLRTPQPSDKLFPKAVTPTPSKPLGAAPAPNTPPPNTGTAAAPVNTAAPASPKPASPK